MGTHSSYQLGCLSRAEGYLLVITQLEVSEREEDVVALHQPIGLLKTCYGLEPVPRCEPNTYHFSIR